MPESTHTPAGPTAPNDLALSGQGDQIVVGQAFNAVAGDAGIAGGGEQLRLPRTAPQRPDQGVLAAAAAHHEDALGASIRLGRIRSKAIPDQSAAMKSSTGIADSVS